MRQSARARAKELSSGAVHRSFFITPRMCACFYAPRFYVPRMSARFYAPRMSARFYAPRFYVPRIAPFCEPLLHTPLRQAQY